jgi:hypothetical protein
MTEQEKQSIPLRIINSRRGMARNIATGVFFVGAVVFGVFGAKAQESPDTTPVGTTISITQQAPSSEGDNPLESHTITDTTLGYARTN